MATTLLTGSGSAELPKRRLTLAVDVDPPGTAFDFELPPGLSHYRQGAGQVVIEEVTSEFVVALLPLGSAVFATPATAHLTIGIPSEFAGFDGDRVVVPNIDLSGSNRRELVTVGPTSDGYRFARVDPARPVDLSSLAEAARSAAQHMLGSRYAVQDNAVRVVIDTSASLLPAIRSGALYDVVDVLAGISVVLSRDDGIEVVLDGAPDTRFERREAAQRVVELLNGAPAESRFTLGTLSPGRGVTFVVTDTVPTEAVQGAGCHLVLICPHPAAELLRPSTTLPLVAVGAPATARLADAFVSEPARLTDFVHHLVQALSPRPVT